MKNLLIITVCLSPILNQIHSQSRYIGQNYERYYEWFHTLSQSEYLYEDNTRLLTFGESIQVKDAACATSNTLLTLAAGHVVQNIAYSDFAPEDEINGYYDIWYHITGIAPTGEKFEGYIWGANIAKAWRYFDFTGDGNKELIMLGVAAMPRNELYDFGAELCILQKEQLLYQKYIPGFCVFEECETDQLLRVIKGPDNTTIIEAVSMAMSCEAGIERVIYYWNGSKMECTYHVEYVTGKVFRDQAFEVISQEKEEVLIKTYQYKGDDEKFDPVWQCKTTVNKPSSVVIRA